MKSLLLVPIIALAAQASDVAITDEVCITTDCVQIAWTILSSMDSSVDPCEDFYDYVCGRWIKEHPIPDHKDAIRVIDPLTEDMAQLIRSALGEPVSDLDIEAIRKAKVFYKSCLDDEDINKSEMRWLREMIEDLGGWPVLGDERNVSLEHALVRMQVLTNNPSGLIPVIVDIAEDDEKSKNIIALDIPNVSTKSANYFDESERKALHANMKKVAIMLGSDPEKADKDLYEVLQFETRLVKRIKKFNQELDDVENEWTVKDLQEKVTQFNWTLYLQEVFQTKDDIKDELLMVPLWTIVEMGDLLENTDRRILQNYIVWNFVMAIKYSMADEFQKAGAVRWRKCVKITRRFFTNPLQYLYVTRAPFDGEEDVAEMFGAIKTAFVESIDEKTWMGEKSRIATKEKTLAINAYTGYSKEFYNISEINGEFKDAVMSPHNFIENFKAINALGFRNQWQLLKQPAQVLKWEADVVDVNAYYYRLSNKVNIPAGFLKAPFYSSTFPNSINYGGLGAVLGHELTHSVDNVGRQFDKDGNIVQWWDNATIEEFEKRAQCISNQYSAFKVGPGNDTYVNGKKTLAENISDIGAIGHAIKAYRKWVEKHGQEPLLPGLDLSHDQLFFVSTALGWCNSARPKSLLYEIQNYNHAPARARIIVPLQNSADFAAAFKCPLGSPMNPVDKCILW